MFKRISKGKLHIKKNSKEKLQNREYFDKNLHTICTRKLYLVNSSTGKFLLAEDFLRKATH